MEWALRAMVRISVIFIKLVFPHFNIFFHHLHQADIVVHAYRLDQRWRLLALLGKFDETVSAYHWISLCFHVAFLNFGKAFLWSFLGRWSECDAFNISLTEVFHYDMLMWNDPGQYGLFLLGVLNVCFWDFVKAVLKIIWQGAERGICEGPLLTWAAFQIRDVEEVWTLCTPKHIDPCPNLPEHFTPRNSIIFPKKWNEFLEVPFRIDCVILTALTILVCFWAIQEFVLTLCEQLIATDAFAQVMSISDEQLNFHPEEVADEIVFVQFTIFQGIEWV